MNEHIKDFIDDIVKFLDEETTDIMYRAQMEDDAHWDEAISTDLTKRWLKSIKPKIETEDDLLEKISEFTRIIESRRYKIAASYGSLAYHANKLSSSNETLKDKIKLLATIIRNETELTINGIDIESLKTEEDFKAKVEELIEISTENACFLMTNLLDNSEFNKIQESCNYKIPNEFRNKDFYLKENIKFHYLMGNEIVKKLELVSHLIRQRKK